MQEGGDRDLGRRRNRRTRGLLCCSGGGGRSNSSSPDQNNSRSVSQEGEQGEETAKKKRKTKDRLQNGEVRLGGDFGILKFKLNRLTIPSQPFCLCFMPLFPVPFPVPPSDVPLSPLFCFERRRPPPPPSPPAPQPPKGQLKDQEDLQGGGGGRGFVHRWRQEHSQQRGRRWQTQERAIKPLLIDR